MLCYSNHEWFLEYECQACVYHSVSFGQNCLHANASSGTLLPMFLNPLTPKIKMQILWTIHIGNVWVMLWELIATSAIVWAKYKMPCSPLCTSYLWVEFEGRTFTLITSRSKRVKRYKKICLKWKYYLITSRVLQQFE